MMDDAIRRAKASCNTSCVTKEELQFESIDLRVQRMLFYMDRKEVVLMETREVKLVRKYFNIWKGEDKLVSMRENIEQEMKTFCSQQVRKAVESCQDVKHFMSRLR